MGHCVVFSSGEGDPAALRAHHLMGPMECICAFHETGFSIRIEKKWAFYLSCIPYSLLKRSISYQRDA